MKRNYDAWRSKCEASGFDVCPKCGAIHTMKILKCRECGYE